VVHAALQEPWRTGLVVTMFGGMLCDAVTPVWFGTHTLLFVAAHAVLSRLRERIPRDDAVASILVALLTNLALFLLFSFTQIHRSPAPAAAWTRLVMDLVCSQIFIVLITPWFLALQTRALVLAGVRRQNL
jgi:rod shape-determining protein MreD